MASKALKIVGIGCGALVLIAVIGMVAAGYWVKGKMEGAGEWAEKMETQQKEINALESSYAFKAPAEGERLELTESRINRYLAIRRGIEPAFKKFEEESKKFEKTDSQEASMSDALAAVGAIGTLTMDVRGAFIEQLKQAKMAPSEFHAIRNAIYSSMEQPESDAGKLLEAHKAELEKHMESVALDSMLVAEGGTP